MLPLVSIALIPALTTRFERLVCAGRAIGFAASALLFVLLAAAPRRGRRMTRTHAISAALIFINVRGGGEDIWLS